MKHLIFAALVAAMALPMTGLASSPVQISGNGISVKTDNKTIDITVDSTATGAKATIVMNGDTVASADVNNLIGRLNDTLLSSSFSYSTSNYDEGENDEYYQLRELELDYESKQDLRTQLTAISIVGIIFGSIALTVIVILIIFYMNRRRRLQIIEKAIENNYTLPDSFYSTKTTKTQYIIEGPAGNTTQPTPRQQYTSDQDLRRGLTVAIVGFGLILFFLTIGIDFLAALSVIPFMYGVGRILIPYLRRLNGTTVPPMPGNQTTTQNQPDRQQQPDPCSNNTTTTTPPAFSHDNTQAQDEK